MFKLEATSNQQIQSAFAILKIDEVTKMQGSYDYLLQRCSLFLHIHFALPLWAKVWFCGGSSTGWGRG